MIGIFLVLVSNVSYIANNYIVKIYSLSASEVSLVRGCQQVLVFSVILVYKNCRSQNEVTDDSKSRSYIKKLFLILLHGFFTATLSFSCVFAVSLMPISDLIVLGFSSPIFSVFLEAFFLKRQLTLVSVFLVFLIGNYYSNLIYFNIFYLQLQETFLLFNHLSCLKHQHQMSPPHHSIHQKNLSQH